MFAQMNWQDLAVGLGLSVVVALLSHSWRPVSSASVS